MAKHRELAQVVYDNTLGRPSASRIWRTVVVAGAMLGAPLAASAEQAPAQKVPAPAPTPAKAPAPAKAMPVQAKPAMPPQPVDKAAEAKAAKDRLTALETELAALDKQRTELQVKVKAARAEWKKADAAAKPPRPRTEENFRPKGRGFVLS